MPESYNDNLHKHSTPKIYEYAKDLRQNCTVAEQLLWENIRNKKLSGLKFRRQHPIDNYIADFYCHEKKLAIDWMGIFTILKKQRSLMLTELLCLLN